MHSEVESGVPAPEGLLLSEAVVLLIQALSRIYPEKGSTDDFIEVVTRDPKLIKWT